MRIPLYYFVVNLYDFLCLKIDDIIYISGFREYSIFRKDHIISRGEELEQKDEQKPFLNWINTQFGEAFRIAFEIKGIVSEPQLNGWICKFTLTTANNEIYHCVSVNPEGRIIAIIPEVGRTYTFEGVMIDGIFYL